MEIPQEPATAEDDARRLVQTHGPRLFALALRLCDDPTEAEELVFRTLERALAALGRYRPEGPFEAWLRTILLNLRRNDLRARAARPPSTSVLPDPAAVPDPGPSPAELTAARADAEASVDSSLRRDEYGTIVGRNPGLRGWIADNCPALMKHYQTLLGYRRLAAEFRDAHDLGDPCPAALLLGENPAAEAKLPPRTRTLLPAARRRARTRLKESESEAATVKAFAEKLKRSWAEPRDRMRRLA